MHVVQNELRERPKKSLSECHKPYAWELCVSEMYVKWVLYECQNVVENTSKRKSVGERYSLKNMVILALYTK